VLLPSILDLILYRIGYKTTINLEDKTPPARISSLIPRCDIFTIALKIGPKEKALHDNLTLHLLKRIAVGSIEDPSFKKKSAIGISVGDTSGPET
jgi:hypothetical protein